jgi:FSR family fosmidomycin resistance protein-like MFS transporter
LTRFRGRLHPTVLLMAGAHFMVDGYGNIYAPLLPLLIPRLGLSLAAAGTLTMLYQIAASVSQVAFGRLADSWRPRLLVMIGPVIAVSLLSLIGLATTKTMLALILFAGGLGGAAFHPPAAALAHRLGGARPGLAMSVHITGGTLGFSMGPLLFAPFAERFGIEWTPLLAIPGLMVIALFLRRVPAFPQRHGERSTFRSLRPYVKPLGLLYLIVVLRTLTSLSFATFVPVMMTRRGASLGEAGSTVALYLFASGVGGFFGGPAADRFGARRVIAWSLILSTPFLVAAPLVSGWLFVVLLAVGGMFLQSTLPVNVVFGQSLAPVSAATVSSLMMGFAWGTGGLSVPFVGMIADRVGIAPTLAGLALIPLAAAACTWPLPATAHAAAGRGRLDPVEPGAPDARL